MSKPAFACNRNGRMRSSRSVGWSTPGFGPRASRSPKPIVAPKLEDLLHSLQANSFLRLPIQRKKGMLEGLLELLRRGQKKVIIEASLRILGDSPDGLVGDEEEFPAQLIEKLVRAAVSKVNDTVRSLLWDVLLKMDANPEAYIRAKDFVREFWSDEPLGRANVIKFLLERFEVDDVLEAVDRYVPPGGRKMPVGSCWCLIRYAKTERMAAKRARSLRRILDRSEIPAEKATVYFSEVLKALDRFSLIEVFSGRAIDQVPTSWPNIAPIQMNLGFNTQAEKGVRPSNFGKRLDLIEMAGIQKSDG